MQNTMVQATGTSSISRGFGTRAIVNRDKVFDLLLDNIVQSKGGQKTISLGKTIRDKTISSKEKPAGLSDYRESKDAHIGKVYQSSQAKIIKDKVDNTKKPSDDSKQALVGEILNMLGQIQNLLMEELNLTSEELDSMMTELGISLTDLTSPQALMELLLYKEGAIDPTEVLMDEDLSGTFQDILGSVEDIRQEALPELTSKDIQQILAQIELNEAMEDSDVHMKYSATHVDDSVIQSTADSIQSSVVDYTDQDDNVVMDTFNHNSYIKSQFATQEVTPEDLDPGTDNQGIVSMDNSNLANNNLSDTAKGGTGTDDLEGFQFFIDNLSANYEKPIVEFARNDLQIYNISDIAQEIIERIRVMAKPGQTTMELQLYPEYLGKVNLTVSSKEGLMSVGFVVENEMAKEAVEKHLIILKKSFAEQGIKVDNIDVTVGSYTFEDKNQSDENNHSTERKASRGRKITFEEAVAMSEEPIDNENLDYIIGTRGHSVNYQA